ncbi:pyridoxamine 5'-phosphate oxidase [bacterium]|nr:pyridoxamine 5'-phosphate oxidase [bacterium]|tara:strand:+ start:654 stop:1277 length:624 start_codon:yes stop_codon:yes gene_type:complete
MNINKTRKIYKDKKSIFSNNHSPLALFKTWYSEAEKKVTEPNAFSLSTTYRNKPSSRMMLLKSFSNTFTFYTNNNSRKGKDIDSNKFASILFWWKEMQRQVRIEGYLKQLSESTVKKYFYSRPRESQIGALSSNQSSSLSSYNELVNEFNRNNIIYKNKKIPFPQNWTGFQLKPSLIEFWQGGKNRLHQRIEYKRKDKKWEIRILAP